MSTTPTTERDAHALLARLKDAVGPQQPSYRGRRVLVADADIRGAVALIEEAVRYVRRAATRSANDAAFKAAEDAA